MRTKIVEGLTVDLYLKALVGRFEPSEWERQAEASKLLTGVSVPLLDQEGWTDKHFLILDLSSPGPGGLFRMGGLPSYDLKKRITGRY